MSYCCSEYCWSQINQSCRWLVSGCLKEVSSGRFISCADLHLLCRHTRSYLFCSNWPWFNMCLFLLNHLVIYYKYSYSCHVKYNFFIPQRPSKCSNICETVDGFGSCYNKQVFPKIWKITPTERVQLQGITSERSIHQEISVRI